MRKPLFSKRSLIAPVRLRRVASGLMIDSVRSVAMKIRSGCSGAGGYSGSVAGRQSALLLPAGRSLLPIGQAVAGGLGLAPAVAGGGDGALVIAVEQVDHAGEPVEVGGCDAVDQDQHRGAVRRVGTGGQPDRLLVGLPSRAEPCGRKVASP